MFKVARLLNPWTLASKKTSNFRKNVPVILYNGRSLFMWFRKCAVFIFSQQYTHFAVVPIHNQIQISLQATHTETHIRGHKYILMHPPSHCRKSTSDRIFVISSVRKRIKVRNTIHSTAHPGAKATYKLLRTKVIWPYMWRDVKIWCKACLQCQSNKISRYTKPPLLSFPTGSRFDTIHMDIGGSIPPCDGFSYLLTIIDRNTRLLEDFPMRSITTETIIDIFVNNWLTRFG